MEDEDKKELKKIKTQNRVLLIILVVIILIIIYFFIDEIIYVRTNDCLVVNNSPMSTQEIEAFNGQFIIYSGEQTGAKLKSMIGTLIANTNTYRDDSQKIPNLIYKNSDNEILYKCDKDEETFDEDFLEKYVKVAGTIRNFVIAKDNYKTEFEYQDNGLINTIIIIEE